MRLAVLILTLFSSLARASDSLSPLTREEISRGWLLAFDGESTFGWKWEGSLEVKDGNLIFGGTQKTEAFSTLKLTKAKAVLVFSLEGPGIPSLTVGGKQIKLVAHKGMQRLELEINPTGDSLEPIVELNVPAGSQIVFSKIACIPMGGISLFNGKDLNGWKPFRGEKYKSVYSVRPEGWLNVKNGPGDLQTDRKFDNFVLQLECFSKGKALNSGIFFRCIADQYQNGYEMQIHNGYKENDRDKTHRLRHGCDLQTHTSAKSGQQ